MTFFFNVFTEKPKSPHLPLKIEQLTVTARRESLLIFMVR